MRRLLSVAAVASALATLALAGAACESRTATPQPAATTPAAVAAKPAPTPVDPEKLPSAWRADAGRLPGNVASSLEFIEFMLSTHRSTMDQVTCHCCDKSLAQCYLDTATKAPKACSPLCSVCQHEGRDVVAAVKVGMPIDELRAGLARAYSGSSH